MVQLTTLRPVLTESAASLSARSINADAPPPSMNVFFEALNKLRDGMDSRPPSTSSSSTFSSSSSTTFSTSPDSVTALSLLSAAKEVDSAREEVDAGGVEGVDIDNEMLGVTVCILPPKKSSKVIASEE